MHGIQRVSRSLRMRKEEQLALEADLNDQHRSLSRSRTLPIA